MALKVTTEPMENRQLAVSIEVPQERVEKELRKAASKLASEYRMPGFRKGKAPYNLVVQYFGVQALYNEFVDELGQAVYKEAMEQEKFEPYAQASLIDINLEPLTYKLTVPLEPVIELGDYRSIRVEADAVEVSDEDVNKRLESHRERLASWQDVERPSQYGDMMNINVRSVIIPAEGEESSEETVVLDETDWDVTPDQENPMEPAGFDEALIGLAPGEEKEFTLGWPADSQSIYAGKEARFHVKVNGIRAYEMPELNDDFAALVGPDYETLDDLKKNIRETLTETAANDAKNAYLEKALDAVLEQATLDYPPTVVEDQLDAMMGDYEQRLRQFGIESLEDFLRQSGQDPAEYRESQREAAKLIAERNLVISELLRAEQIEVAEEDIEAKIGQIVGSSDEGDDEARDTSKSLAEMLRSGSGRPLLESQILQEKTLDRLLAIVRGEEVPELSAPAAEAAEGERGDELTVESATTGAVEAGAPLAADVDAAEAQD